jgi:hypothetical protein
MNLDGCWAGSSPEVPDVWGYRRRRRRRRVHALSARRLLPQRNRQQVRASAIAPNVAQHHYTHTGSTHDDAQSIHTPSGGARSRALLHIKGGILLGRA